MTSPHQPGDTVDVTVTYLEMAVRPLYERPSAPAGPPLMLIGAHQPPVWYFLSLYSAVGRDWFWTDKYRQTPDQMRAWLQQPDMHLYTLIRDGWPAGFYMLDRKVAGVCDLAYFGLVPDMVGRGLGTYLLRTAIHMAWDGPGTEKLTIETCTLDHPRALGLYQRAGFAPVKQATDRRTLVRPPVLELPK